MRTSSAIIIILTIVACSQKQQVTIDPFAYSESIKEHRVDYLADFLKDPRAPLDSTDLVDIHFFDVDINYRCVCELEKYEQMQPFAMSTYAGTVQDYLKIGTASCTINKTSFSLALYQNVKMLRMPMYRNRYFIPFRDITNGETTYGGGRYIDLQADSVDKGQVVIDFNKSYNPWCAYSDGYACPIPPVENHLDLSIEAGEALYTGTYKEG